MVVFEDKITKISYEKKYSLIIIDRKAAADLSEDEYKKDVLNWADCLQKYKPSRQLVNEKEFKYSVVPDLQIWVNQVLVAPAIKDGMKKVAFVVADDIFPQVSIEQLMEENKLPLEMKYFQTQKEARAWLLKD